MAKRVVRLGQSLAGAKDKRQSAEEFLRALRETLMAQTPKPREQYN